MKTLYKLTYLIKIRFKKKENNLYKKNFYVFPLI